MVWYQSHVMVNLYVKLYSLSWREHGGIGYQFDVMLSLYNNSKGLQYIEGQGPSIDCWPYVHFSRDRGERSSDQFRGELWSSSWVSTGIVGFLDHDYSYKSVDTQIPHGVVWNQSILQGSNPGPCTWSSASASTLWWW